MVKCVLLFLLPIVIACSIDNENRNDLIVRFTQIGNVSKFEQGDNILFPDTLSNNLRIMKISEEVSVWEIDGDICDSLMIKQNNSIAVLGGDTVLPKVLALDFSQIILKPNFPDKKMLYIFQNYSGITKNAAVHEEIILNTDGRFWYQQN